MDETPEYQDLARLTTAVLAAVGVSILIALIALWSGWMEIDLLQRIKDGRFVTPAQADASDNRQQVIAVVSTLSYVVTAVLFLRWVYLANRNARSLGARDMRFTPGWAVGWFFIPIASLWKPFQVMTETFKASHPAPGGPWQQAKVPAVVQVWWSTTIIAVLVSQGIVRLGFEAETLDELIAASRWSFASDLLGIPAGIAMVVMLAILASWQAEKRAKPTVSPAGMLPGYQP